MKGYGWLGSAFKNQNWWFGGLGGGELYPAWVVEANTAALWLMDEASGNIVDEVSSITAIAQGTPTYSATATGPFSNWSPGISLSEATGSYFAKGSAQTTLDLPATGEDFVTEVAFSNTGAANDRLYWFSRVSDDHGYDVTLNNTTVTTRYEADDDTLTGGAKAVSAMNDGNIHKLRIAGDRSASEEIFLDGVSQGTTTISSVAAKKVTAHDVQIGRYGTTASTNFNGTIYCVKITIGDVTTNSGGPNGG